MFGTGKRGRIYRLLLEASGRIEFMLKTFNAGQLQATDKDEEILKICIKYLTAAKTNIDTLLKIDERIAQVFTEEFG